MFIAIAASTSMAIVSFPFLLLNVFYLSHDSASPGLIYCLTFGRMTQSYFCWSVTISLFLVLHL